MSAAPIQRALVGVDLGGGVDTFTDVKMVLPGSLVDGQNVRYNKDGVIQRRNGAAALGTLTVPASVDKLLIRDEQMAGYSKADGTLSRYDGTRWVSSQVGYLPVPWLKSRSVGPTNNDIGSNLFFGYSLDVATNAPSGGTEMAVAYLADGSNATIDLCDIFTGAVSQTFSIAGPASDIRIAYNPTTTDYLVALNTAQSALSGSAAGTIKIYKIRAGTAGSTLVWTSPSNAVGGGIGFDFCNQPNDGVFPVLYCAASNVITLGFLQWNGASYTSLTAVTTTAAGQPTSVAIARPSPQIGLGFKCFIAGSAVTGTKGFFSDGSTVTTALFTVSANNDGVTACQDNSGNCYVSQRSATNTTARYKVTSAAVVSSLDTFRVGTPASTIQLDATSQDCCYQWMKYTIFTLGQSFQDCYFLARLGFTAGLNDYQPIGRVLYGKASYYGPQFFGVPSLVDLTSKSGAQKSMSTVLQSVPIVAGNPDTLRTSLNLVTFGLDPASGWQTVEARKTLFVSGGHLAKFDGISITENGFLLAPEKPTLAAAGSGLLTAGTYQVCVVFEEVDAQGNAHQSAAGIIASITLSGGVGNNAISVTAAAYAATNPNKQMRLAYYRSEVNKTVLYREGIGAMTPTSGSIVGTLGFISDATLATKPQLYTGGGSEDNYQPSAPLALSLDQNRVTVVEGDNLNRVTTSKRLVPGNALAFFPDYYRAIESGTSELTGIAGLLGRKVAFKKRGLFVAAGDGPDDTLQADTLSQFEERSKDIGAIDPRSIVSTQDGIVFRSIKGFFLFGTDSSLTYIGADVDAYSDPATFKYQFASYNKDSGEIVFVSQSATPAVLVLRIFRNKRGVQFKWTTATLNGQANVKDVAMWGGGTTGKQLMALALNSSGGGSLVAVETPGLYSDAAIAPAAHVQQLISTGWIKMNGIAGLGRLYGIYFLGTSYSSHQLNVDIAYDYETTWFETRSISSVNAVIGNSAYFGKIQPTRQRCTAFRLRIYDSKHTNAAKDTYDLSGLMLDVGVYSGGARLRAEKLA